MDIGHFPTLTCWKWPGTKSAQSHKMTPQERQYKISLTANTKSVLKTFIVVPTKANYKRRPAPEGAASVCERELAT